MIISGASGADGKSKGHWSENKARIKREQVEQGGVEEKQSSTYPGVIHVPGRKLPWRAMLKKNGKRTYLGFYFTQEDAHQARVAHIEANPKPTAAVEPSS
jgi:alpha-galactosidase